MIYNRGGAGGSIGMDEVAKAPPDGYTLLLDHSGLTYMPGLYRNLPFDPVKDFAAIITAVVRHLRAGGEQRSAGAFGRRT